jgi:hypothetical protein
MCTDSRAINKKTIRYRFPLPRMDDLMDFLSGAKYFSNIDLKSGYHQIRMREGDEWKTTFKTNEGLYEWLVMLFGITNEPSTFMRLMNEVVKEFIGKFVIVYLDDILIFSKTMAKHLKHLATVMQKLQQEKLLINMKKSSFMKTELIYLGFVISADKLRMDPDKVEVIKNWPSSKNIFEVRSFHGLASFYQNFIRNFSGISAPMMDTVKKRHKYFHWTEEAKKSFNLLKRKITKQPILVLLDFQRTFQVKCDASGFAIGAVLSQEDRPIAYFNEKMNETKEFKIKTLGFDDLRDMYRDDPNFKEAYEASKNPILRDIRQWIEYMIQEGLLFNGNHLCIPKCSMRENLLKEKHNGGLAGHFGHDKMFANLNESYLWPGMIATSKDLQINAEFVSIRKERDRMQDFINHFPYLSGHGMQSAWILYWVCQEHKEDLTQSLWWWIDFPKWHTSFHVRKPVTQLTLRIYFSKKSFDFMAYQGA